LHYRVTCPRWSESPDAFVTLSKDRVVQRVGIEHTDYFNDTVAGAASATTPIAEFWENTQASLMRRISHRKHLAGVNARVRLRSRMSLPSPKDRLALARRLAEALVAFVECHYDSLLDHHRWHTPDFESGSLLRKMVESLLLSKGFCGSASRSAWVCSNVATGNIGLSIDYLRSAVAKKNQKAPKYSRDGAQELWLLITAAGDTVSNHAGPFPPAAALHDATLLSHCKSSPFDRIVFWERIRCWYVWLKPLKAPVQYRDSYVH
jgi:hypothetical protein